ncbi:MAG: HAMP domain-containing protein [Magnetococcales bacterium]|nr:HAMP domain-containing protein [Magnetococcales bacterium]
MRLDDLPIRLKLPLTIGVGLFLFAGVVLFYTLVLRQTLGEYEYRIDHELRIQQEARNIHVELLQARRAEKDFLARRDPALLEGVGERIALAVQSAREMQRLSVGSAIQQEVADRMVLVDHLEGYHALIREIGADWMAKGLNHREGNQGVFRQAAHALEAEMQRLEHGAGREQRVERLEAMVDYLSMRRLEKDYLLRQEEENAAEVEKLAAGLGGRLQQIIAVVAERQQVEFLLNQYVESFRALVALDRSIAEKMNRLRDSVHRVEPLVEEIDAMAARLAREGVQKTRWTAQQSAQWIFVASLATIVLCGWLSMRMVRGLVRSISTLSHYAREVADGNLDVTTTLVRGDEIGHLAEVMRAMVQRMRAIRLIADRMVVILALVGRGAVPEPLQVEFHGDFKKITDALNDLIARLGAIRRIAASMDEISQGKIPEKLVGEEYQGDFRRIHEAMNLIIDQLRAIGGLPVTVS